jgi:site-specific DNA-methyltransferase (adenine-specific)
MTPHFLLKDLMFLTELKSLVSKGNGYNIIIRNRLTPTLKSKTYKIKMIETNKIYNMDCLELMKKLPDKYFDLIITDPPYGINIASNGYIVGKTNDSCKTGRKNYGIQKWDTSIPSQKYFKEMFRVSKHQIIFGGNYMTQYLSPSSCWIVWDKCVVDKFHCFLSDVELAWTNFDKSSKIFRYVWRGLMQGELHRVGNTNHQEKRMHPTQKPVALGRWILEKFATKGDIIFDPFAGSGSFLVACKQLGYDFVGCEIHKDYVDIIRNRLRQMTVSDFNPAKQENLIAVKRNDFSNEKSLSSLRDEP